MAAGSCEFFRTQGNIHLNPGESKCIIIGAPIPNTDDGTTLILDVLWESNPQQSILMTQKKLVNDPESEESKIAFECTFFNNGQFETDVTVSGNINTSP
ncbi:hypothetical protein [Bacillus wiedmannii]|uniref:hypothetical protein n=1 Tax=Bacillus wiedmannii TaxID=1890302 RepID=UPI001C02F73A|nr:hypothetical protein [Bacillus wiedmannii]QWH69497.1 hypothetical protein EXW41_27570 [Bacillus wiedmannii]